MKNVIIFISFIVVIKSAFATNSLKALKMALDDEYKAKATYQQVIIDFGEIKPFINIVKSEQRHINALLPFFKKYNELVPANPYLNNPPTFSTLEQACEAGVKAEIDNAKLYNTLFSMTDDLELVAIFRNLQWASEKKHLQAFKRCVANN